jgi:hypothetical protein
MWVEFTIEIEGEAGGVVISAPRLGQMEAQAKAAATRLADDAAARGQRAFVYRLQRRWHRREWVDSRRELVYEAAIAAAAAA